MRMNRTGTCLFLLLGALALGACGKNETTLQKPRFGSVNAGAGLRLRTAPDPRAAVVANLPYAAKVSVISNGPRATIDGVTDAWLYVATKGGFGWLFGGYVTLGAYEGAPGTTQMYKSCAELLEPAVPAERKAALERFGQPRSVTSSKTKNRHDGNLDAIHTLEYEGFSLTYYHATTDDKWLLIRVSITSPRIAVRHGLGVGARLETIGRAFGSPDVSTGGEIAYQSGFGRFTWFHANGVVTNVLVVNYPQ